MSGKGTGKEEKRTMGGWEKRERRRERTIRGPVESDGLCNLGQTAGNMAGFAGEPFQGPHSSLATLRKGKALKPGSGVLLLGLLVPLCTLYTHV